MADTPRIPRPFMRKVSSKRSCRTRASIGTHLFSVKGSIYHWWARFAHGLCWLARYEPPANIPLIRSRVANAPLEVKSWHFTPEIGQRRQRQEPRTNFRLNTLVENEAMRHIWCSFIEEFRHQERVDE